MMVEIKIMDSNETVKIGKVMCLCRSYRAHAAEMGSAVPEVPEFFLKPSTSVIRNHENINLPKESEEVHHEVELAIVIGKGGKHIPKEDEKWKRS